MVSKTLYGQKYLTITVDEAHNFRNTGPRHSSILLLLNKAEIRLILTATPLQTSTKVAKWSFPSHYRRSCHVRM
jgi:TATA-binding protein-associated factor